MVDGVESRLAAIESRLSDSQSQWLGGDEPSKEDHLECLAVSRSNVKPDPAVHPRTSAWFAVVSGYPNRIRGKWPVLR